MALLLAPLGAPQAASRTIHVEASAIEEVKPTGGEPASGILRFVSGLELASGDADFGGLSGLVIDADGKSLIAVTDRGHWFQARLRRGTGDRLAGLADTRLVPMRNADGRPVSIARGTHDAEGLARMANGDLLVAFERANRILIYPAGPGMLEARPRRFGYRAHVQEFRMARGLEALAVLSDGTVLVLEENKRKDAAHFLGWRGKPGTQTPARLDYATLDPFKPVGMARLENGDLLVLERRFSVLGGFASRVVRISAATVLNDTALDGTEEVLRLEAPGLRDNSEAIAAHPLAGGAHAVYLLSDDNFNFLQRTLLLQFVLER